MKKAQKIWKILAPLLVIEVKKGKEFIIPKEKDIILSCPKFFYMSDEELDCLLSQKKI